MPQTLAVPVEDAHVAPANRKRFTRTECDFLERTGVLTERYELLNGEIIVNVGQNQPHAICVMRVILWLALVFGGDRILTQAPVEVAEADHAGNRPEPDVFVLEQPAAAYAQTPKGSDTRLVVEVADSTLRDDLQTKAALYARAGVPEYWVVDVPSRRLIAHLAPGPQGYTDVAAYAENETVAAQAAPGRPVRVAELLPPVQPSPAAGA
uniref:Putative restriction endonuclease domain-containing protein n=1 Tax=uncultured Armatimonadetes bacterium TaxID=157466 RepID=A0A6J4JEX2_9BACT|nr:hypothetical protein AVDCRST_MAG63-3282 [uncultured Armatimonadetes bacterium]